MLSFLASGRALWCISSPKESSCFNVFRPYFDALVFFLPDLMCIASCLEAEKDRYTPFLCDKKLKSKSTLWAQNSPSCKNSLNAAKASFSFSPFFRSAIVIPVISDMLAGRWSLFISLSKLSVKNTVFVLHCTDLYCLWVFGFEPFVSMSTKQKTVSSMEFVDVFRCKYPSVSDREIPHPLQNSTAVSGSNHPPPAFAANGTISSFWIGNVFKKYRCLLWRAYKPQK